jgi:hypothetical protein
MPLPILMADLPTNRAGYVVPWFVDRDADTPDGEPDFRVMDSRKLQAAIRRHLCWVCGQRLDRLASFVVGPMCAINRTSAEPPCHYPCATYSARVCPFLSRPKMTRRDRHMPDGHIPPAGFMIERNPGVALVWTTRQPSWYRVPNGVLFDIGDPQRTDWWCEGRRATSAEIVASIDSGLPILRDVAQAEGADAVAELDQRHRDVLELIGALP